MATARCTAVGSTADCIGLPARSRTTHRSMSLTISATARGAGPLLRLRRKSASGVGQDRRARARGGSRGALAPCALRRTGQASSCRSGPANLPDCAEPCLRANSRDSSPTRDYPAPAAPRNLIPAAVEGVRQGSRGAATGVRNDCLVDSAGARASTARLS